MMIIPVIPDSTVKHICYFLLFLGLTIWASIDLIKSVGKTVTKRDLMKIFIIGLLFNISFAMGVSIYYELR